MPHQPSHQRVTHNSYKYQSGSQKNGIVRQLLNQTTHTTIPASFEDNLGKTNYEFASALELNLFSELTSSNRVRSEEASERAD